MFHWEDWKPRSVEDLSPIEPGDFPFVSPPDGEAPDSSRAETDQYLQRLAEWEDGFGGSHRTEQLSNCGYHIDLVSSGSDEESFLSHKYYADPRECADWMPSFPDSEMPAHEDPPYDRHRHLPKRGWP